MFEGGYMSNTAIDFYNMRDDEALLITGVEYEIVRNKKIHEFPLYGADIGKVYPINGTDECIYARTVVNLPIMQFGKRENGQNKRMYVAYSPEVEELLDKPYTLMHEDLEKANKLIKKQYLRLSAYSSATFWQKIKYLFGVDIRGQE
jgi:hypothetical protein